MEYIHAALLLHKLGKEISEDNLKGVVAAAGSEVDEGKIKSLIQVIRGILLNVIVQSSQVENGIQTWFTEYFFKRKEGDASKDICIIQTALGDSIHHFYPFLPNLSGSPLNR